MILDYISLSLASLRTRGLRSLLTMLGIFLGIAAVVSLISLGTGLQNAITGQFSTLDPDKLLVQNAGTGFGPPGSLAIRKLTEHDQAIIERVVGVEIVVPRLVRTVRMTYNDKTEFAFVGSVPSDSEEREIVYDALNAEAAKGKLIEDERGLIVAGDDYTDYRFGKPLRVGSKVDIQGETFEVGGIMERAQSFQINAALLMNEEDLKEVLAIDDEIDLLVVQVEDDDRIEEVAAAIERALREDRDEKLGEEDFSVQTPVQALSTINTILTTIQLVVAGIAALSLVVGGIGIANTMYTSVLERTKEIGVMKAIGARNRDVLIIFVVESAFLGLAGGIIGAIIGLGLAFAVSGIVGAFLGGIDLQVTLSWPLIGGAILFSLVIGMISGLLPALQASRLNPVEALRS